MTDQHRPRRRLWALLLLRLLHLLLRHRPLRRLRHRKSRSAGAVTFESVGVDTEADAFVLDLSDLTPLPARGVVVEAVSATGAVLATTTTDTSGAYALDVDANTDVQIQVKAQLLQTTGATWNIPVLDNTSGNALYVLTGSLANSGTADSTRDLFAPSGSDGVSAYTSTRAAAPFAILDGIFDGLQLVESVDPDVVFPDAQIFWSINNRPTDGEVADGEIGSSSFTTIGGVPTILILGDTGTDTDEYDEHVITHEFGHYFENSLSRADSIGGSHSLDSLLDARVSFSEGWGNALSAMITGDSIYVDAGFGSNNGFAFNVELNGIGNFLDADGWYGESSVQSIIFDVFDSNSDGPDTISAGFAPIYNAFLNPIYRDSDAATTIFSFAEALAAEATVPAASLQALLDFQDINGTGAFGVGETNDGGIMTALPVFPTLTVGDAPITICSVDDAELFNRIGNRTLISLNVPTAGTFTIRMERVSGDLGRDPDFFIFNEGAFITNGISPATDVEVQTRTLPAGQLIVDAHDFNNLDLNDASVPGDACYDFSVQ